MYFLSLIIEGNIGREEIRKKVFDRLNKQNIWRTL